MKGSMVSLLLVGFLVVLSCSGVRAQSCNETALREQRIATIYSYIDNGSWLKNPTLDMWTSINNNLTTENFTLVIVQVGIYNPQWYANEYGLLVNKQYSYGQSFYLNRTVIADSFQWNDNNVFFRVHDVLSILNSTKEGDGVYNYTFVDDCDNGWKIAYATANLPFVFEGLNTTLDLTQLCFGIQTFCTGNNSQYSGVSECISFMSKLPATCASYAYQGNTTFCRRLHLLASQVDPDHHCPHTGYNSTTCTQDFCAANDYIYPSPAISTTTTSGNSSGAPANITAAVALVLLLALLS